MKYSAMNSPAGCLTGSSIEAPIGELLHDDGAMRSLARRTSRSLRDQRPITLMLRDFEVDVDPATELETFCARLNDLGLGPDSSLGLCLAQPVVPMHVYTLVTRRFLGKGPRYVATQRSRGMQLSDRAWRYIWRHRSTRWAVWPAYGAAVTPQCPLLSDEKAESVLPPMGIHAPGGSAWLGMRFRLDRHLDSNGDICLAGLERALCRCIDYGDRLLDSPVFDPGPGDLRRNRRMAISLTGFGDLVRQQRRCPSDFSALRDCVQLAQHVRACVRQRSMQLAKKSELLPAIAETRPVTIAGAHEHNQAWSARWQVAVQRTAVRHRNLLVMSPYCVLPAGDPGRAAYMDLLPVLACADAHCFADPPSFEGWNLPSFVRFHRRAKAVIGHQSDASVIATRV